MIVYPEGTATRDPDLWPMVAKTGVARLALTTGAPVIPIAHWGAQEILPYGSKKPHLFPRKTVRMAAGPPVDLSAYAGQRLGASTLRAATDDIMADITALLAKIRQETPPAVPWDPAAGGRVSLGRTERRFHAWLRGQPGRGGADGRSRLRSGMKAAVLGAGSWGTTFAQVLCDAGTRTVLYARNPQLAKAITELHENPDYLPGIALTPALDATPDPAEALDGADLVVFAVPAQSLRANLVAWAPLIPPGALLVSLIKGIELGTCQRMSEVIIEVLGADAGAGRRGLRAEPGRRDRRRQFAATVVACAAEDGALALQGACHTPYFRPYTNTDVIGCELGGTVKNVIALAVGIAVAMGLGDNTKATLITRGLAEIARLGVGARRASRRRSPGWPGWATWWPPAARRCRATGRSASTWGAA